MVPSSHTPAPGLGDGVSPGSLYHHRAALGDNVCRPAVMFSQPSVARLPPLWRALVSAVPALDDVGLAEAGVVPYWMEAENQAEREQLVYAKLGLSYGNWENIRFHPSS